MSSSTSTGPCIGIMSPGAMGAAVASVLTHRGCTVLTILTGRSTATRKRAEDAGMQDVASLSEIGRRARWVLSIVPPSGAEKLATDFLAAVKDQEAKESGENVVFVDCNAVNPVTAKRIAGLFKGTGVGFIDASILGYPPQGDYNPNLYASVDRGDEGLLEEFAALKGRGLPVVSMEGEGTGIGDASALKMSYAGILKGTIGLYTNMILAAHASSPATATALVNELHHSKPAVLGDLIQYVPQMVPKSGRWVKEMEEIAGFIGEGEGEVFTGMAKLFSRIDQSIQQDGADVGVLKKFVEDARVLLPYCRSRTPDYAY